MRYESGKSFILTILILVSTVLTWNLWTYQPNYDPMEKDKTVREVTVSTKQEIQKIVKPDQILFHQKGGHYGTVNSNELDKVIKEMEKWTFSDVKNYTGKVTNLKQLMHGNGTTEIIFPGDVPIQLYRSVINFEERKIPSFNFNRMIINVENSGKDKGIVYFASSNSQQVYISYITSTNLALFTRDFYKNASKLPKYFAYDANSKNTIFLPEAETQMKKYKYLPRPLNADEFKDALFSDPSYVQKSSISSGEELYTDAFSKMTVNYYSGMLVYVNPSETNYTESSYNLAKRSIDFVNEHGGFTDPYRFVSKDDAAHSVTFRLYSIDGYPVFSDKGSSELTEVWGREEINKYIRPNVALELPLTTETQTVIRPSGHEVLDYLKSQKSFRPELLDQIVLGYKMVKDPDEQQLILLEPAWYYRYDKVWKQITLDDLGGMKHGLE